MRPADPSARKQRQRRSLARHGSTLLVLAVVLSVGWVFRFTPNEDRGLGEAAAARLDAAYADVVAGAVTVGEGTTLVAPQVQAATLSLASGDVVVLVTTTGKDCYVLWWDADLVRHGRIVDDQLPCEPAPVVTSMRPIHFERAGPAVRDPGVPYPWQDVLPDPERLRYFVLPGAILGLGAMLSILVRMSIVVITGEPPG